MPEMPVSVGTPTWIEPGTYECRCTEVENIDIEQPLYGNGAAVKVRVVFPDVIDDATDAPAELNGIANRVLSPKSKLWGWVEAFGFPLDPEVTKSFNTDRLVNQRALAKVVDNPKADGTVWSKIDDFIAMPRRGGSAARPTSSAATVPAIIKADGSVDFGVFWKAVRAAGKDKPDVLALPEIAGDLANLENMDPTDVPALLEQLLA